ncbi:MAG TPA: NifU N-terminal domain-containing protein [Planctomycetota bacterium]|nr:NifU N-terminal domain-containing protein [Planctomycetota bacterium]
MPAQVRLDSTPNPNSLKITVSVAVSAKPVTFASAAAADADPLAKKLFAVSGVKSVFMIANFVTVTKDPAVAWEDLSDRLEDIVSSHFS